MNTPQTHYEALGVTPDAELVEIKRRYHDLVQRCHPDVSRDVPVAVIVRLNLAYQVLRDPERRRAYDAALSGGLTPGNPASPSSKPAPPPVADVAKLLADAEAAYMQGRANDAHRLCQQALKADGRNVQALSLLSDTLVQLGKPEFAATALRIAQRIAPSPALQAKLHRLEMAAQRSQNPSPASQNRHP